MTLEQRRVQDKGNRLMQVEGSPGAVLVDRAGRMTQVPPSTAGEWHPEQKLVWDAWSRLVAVADDVHGVTGSYTYDGLNRRMTRVVSGVTWHTYYSNAWRPLEERQDSQTTAARQYYWGARHRDDLLRRDRATTSGGALDETRYVLMDYFSPAAITDESGAVTERYAFSAFGVRSIMAPDFSARTASECEWDFGFQGQFLDWESGFYNYGYRYYSPPLGRWLSKDPIEEEGGVNLYGFVENSGMNGVDLLGLIDKATTVLPAELVNEIHKGGVAARRASDDYFTKKKTFVEYCGLVCTRCVDGKWEYEHTPPVTLESSDGCAFWRSPCKKGWTQAAAYHNHPAGKVWPSAPNRPGVNGFNDVDIATKGHITTQLQPGMDAGLPVGATSPTGDNSPTAKQGSYKDTTKIYAPKTRQFYDGPSTPR